jgi:protein SCO1
MKSGVLYATALLVVLNVAVLVYFLFRPAKDVAVPMGEGSPAGIYMVTGVVRELRADGSNVVIRHEAIPGFMMAMTMPFTARDPREVAILQPGDQVTFRLLVTDEDSWIDSVTRRGVVEVPAQIDYERARVVRDVEPLEVGDMVPDYVFTNQFNQVVRLGDYRGRGVALTFVFTRCPLPDFCPRMLKNFQATAQSLVQQSSGPTNWHLLTLTIDPLHDVPSVLRRHAETYQYDPRRWTFLTGALEEIDALSEQVGLYFRRQTPEALPDHNLRTLVITPEGRLARIIVGNEWKPEELVSDVLKVSAGESLDP